MLNREDSFLSLLGVSVEEGGGREVATGKGHQQCRRSCIQSVQVGNDERLQIAEVNKSSRLQPSQYYRVFRGSVPVCHLNPTNCFCLALHGKC